MKKELAKYMQEVCRKAYLQGASDASNGYVANNNHDIDAIIDHVCREILSRKRGES